MKKIISLLFLMHALVVSPLSIGSVDLPVMEGVGGDFTAKSTLGHPLSTESLRGKVVLLFFGYTNCPDVCPLTLSRVTGLMDQLEQYQSDIEVLFVTLDPEYDTTDHLRDYLKNFDSRYIGISGTREEIDRIVSLFKARYTRKAEQQITTQFNRYEKNSDSFFIYSHSQNIYLLDKQGRVRSLFYVGTPVKEVRKNIIDLINEGN